MRSRVLIAVLATLAGLITIPFGASARGSFDHLHPGGFTPLREKVPVNFVFVGYEPDQVKRSKFLAGLPDRYRPQVRSKMFYGLPSDLGIGYSYDYDVTYTNSAFEDRFFGTLSTLADPAPRTVYQQDYNAQATNVLNVRQNHFIDAPTVEQWLIDNAPYGVDTTQDTLFFINWWGRDDFKFHLYTKTDEPDPDTGYNFGIERESRKVIAWGGTTAADEENGVRGTHRVWFYDLSAGPESWTDNWNVDDADLDGNGERDYRMPAIWEYLTPGGDRNRRKLTGDLAKIARYVGIDLLFTTSPLYPPALTPPRMPNSINLDINTYEAWPGVDASNRYLDATLVRDEEAELLRLPTTLDRQDLALTGRAEFCFLRWVKGKICFRNRPQYPDAGANLFLYGALNRGRFTNGGGEYEATIFNYATDFDAGGGLLGYADDNWLDGTQSSVFAFVDPTIVEFGYGLSTTDDPRGRPPRGHEPPARRLRLPEEARLRPLRPLLLRVVGRRVELDHELHRPELGLQPVRPGQPLAHHRGRLPDQHQRDRCRRPGQRRRRRRHGRVARRRRRGRAGAGRVPSSRLRWRVRPRQGRLRARQARRIGRGGPRADRHAGVVRPAAGQAGRRDQRDADVRLGRQAGSAFAPRASVGPAASCVQWTGDATAPVATSCVRHDRGGGPVGELHERARRWGLGRPAGSQRVVGRDPAGPDAVHAPRAVR